MAPVLLSGSAITPCQSADSLAPVTAEPPVRASN